MRIKVKPPKRVTAKLYICNIKFYWDCPYCGSINTADCMEDERLSDPQVVQCFCCGRKRAGLPQQTWYRFTKQKTKRMQLKQKKFKAKFKENKNVKQHSKSVEPERNQRNKTDGKGLEKRRRRIGKRVR